MVGTSPPFFGGESMLITDVRIEPVTARTGKLVASCSLLIDKLLVIHEIKIIRVDSRLIVCMPNRRRTYPCPHCRSGNHKLARFCNYCGKQLQSETNLPHDELYLDILHPVNREARQLLEHAVFSAFSAHSNGDSGQSTEDLEFAEGLD